MTLIDRARHLLTSDELRGRVPDEVAEFLREVVALEPDFHLRWDPGRAAYFVNKPNVAGCAVYTLGQCYTLETPHDAG